MRLFQSTTAAISTLTFAGEARETFASILGHMGYWMHRVDRFVVDSMDPAVKPLTLQPVSFANTAERLGSPIRQDHTCPAIGLRQNQDLAGPSPSPVKPLSNCRG